MNCHIISAFYLAKCAISHLSPQAQKKGVTLVNKLPANILIYGERMLLQQVFHQIISNAIKYSMRGDTVLCHSPSGGEGEVAITDTGVGISPEDLPSLFEMKVKNPAWGTAGEHGSGAGLALCAAILKTCGGSIDAASEMGKGTTVNIHFPKIEPAILLVDDDELLRQLLTTLLGTQKYAVRTAANGAEAMESIRKCPPHLVLSDILMPVMGGYGLLAELQKEPHFSDIPVIIMTGKKTEMMSKAYEAGAVDYISKEFIDVELLPRVNNLFSGYLRKDGMTMRARGGTCET